jgi:hypothetical protein
MMIMVAGPATGLQGRAFHHHHGADARVNRSRARLESPAVMMSHDGEQGSSVVRAVAATRSDRRYRAERTVMPRRLMITIQPNKRWRRSRAAIAEFPDGNPELASLVGQIRRNAGAGTVSDRWSSGSTGLNRTFKAPNHLLLQPRSFL